MGGQACVLYGGSEFSRDIDFVIHANSANLDRLRAALGELEAEIIAVPDFDPDLLAIGLAVHFRCGCEPARGLRVDVMTVLRGVDDFETLWARRTVFQLADQEITTLNIADLVVAKKTQRDKDWPMIRRLVDAHYLAHRAAPSTAQIDFWLCELRSPETLLAVKSAHPDRLASCVEKRPLLSLDVDQLQDALDAEERLERERDHVYWAPLKKRLGELRRAAR